MTSARRFCYGLLLAFAGAYSALWVYLLQHPLAYFVLMPISKESKAMLDPQFVMEYKAHLQRYADKYPNFHLLLTDLPTTPENQMHDSDHQNFIGRLTGPGVSALCINDAKVEGYPYISDWQAERLFEQR